MSPKQELEAGDGALTVREIAAADAMAAARLSGELGYPATAAEMEERIRALRALTDRTAFVACLGDAVAGWIDVGIVHHLQSGPYGEIGGLVVAHDCRNRGVGALLLRRAELWARERNVSKMVVRSRVARADAHRFYLREGYEQTKTSAVFSKPLS
jgi:GNAT superfamily N-acetyltransferase